MKIIIVLLLVLSVPSIKWWGNFNDAQIESAKYHKLILINFSRSDRCGPCIRFRKEILETGVFDAYTKDHLILVRADFPRQKKNQLDKEQVKRNEILAGRYNADGRFPYTLLVDEKGTVLKTYDGFSDINLKFCC